MISENIEQIFSKKLMKVLKLQKKEEDREINLYDIHFFETIRNESESV